MDEHITELTASAERLAAAAEALSQVLTRLDEQQQALNSKVERIVAAIDERAALTPNDDELQQLRQRVSELDRANSELQAQACGTAAPGCAVAQTRATRKTLPPLVSALLAKNGLDAAEAATQIDSTVLDKTLASLSLEQRIAVKAEMARAGIID